MSESDVEPLESPGQTTRSADRWLWLYLRFVGIVTLFAFGAAVMPQAWMMTIAGWLKVDPFPDQPLTFYLARNLSLLYGFVGVGVLVLSHDMDLYCEWIGYLALGTMAFGVGQFIVNAQSSLPWWWTLGEGGSTIFGGALMWWLYRRSSYST